MYARRMKPIGLFDVVTFDARDPRKLAEFYGAIFGFPINEDESDPEWVELSSSTGTTLAFQLSPDHVAPEWPSDTDHLQVHLDIHVEDLDTSEAAVLELGAVKTEFQPFPDDFRVYLDLAGHPFCLCLIGKD